MAVHILHAESHKPGGIDLIANPDLLTVGESTMPRDAISATTVSLGSSQALRLSYFTARTTQTITQIRMMTGGTAAAATPTLCRAGIYSDDGAGALTLVGAIANDATLFAAGSTVYTRSLVSPASFVLTAGVRYAFGILVVSAAAVPTFTGQTAINGTEIFVAPRLAAVFSGQADLPSSIANASLGGSGSRFYAVVLP